jgi:hypothetical protein
MGEVRRLVRWYTKGPGDAFVGEADLRGITLPELQDLFGALDTDPMYDCWPVRAEHIPSLSPHLAIGVELDRYDYFVEADSLG